MGYGCYYTNPEYKTPVAWIDFPYDDGEDDGIGNRLMWLDTITDVQRIACKLFKNHTAFDEPRKYWKTEYKGWGILTQSNSTALIYQEGHCGEMILAVVPSYPEDREGEFALYRANADKNYDSMQDKLYQKLKKDGYEMRRATSGYTSCAI
jgi:hypothetical protein